MHSWEDLKPIRSLWKYFQRLKQTPDLDTDFNVSVCANYL